MELNWNNYKRAPELIERAKKLMCNHTKANGARSYITTRRAYPLLINVEDGIQQEGECR